MTCGYILLAQQRHHSNINSLSQELFAKNFHCTVEVDDRNLHLFQTEVGSESSDRKCRMFKLMSKEIIPDEVPCSTLATEETGMHESVQHVYRGTHNREAQLVGQDDKTQAEDMGVR